MIRKTCLLIVAIMLILASHTFCDVSGEQWVREHPFTISSWNHYGLVATEQMDFYRAAGLNAVRSGENTLELAKMNGVELHVYLYGTQPLSEVIPFMQTVSQDPGDRNAWYVIDEPADQYLPTAAAQTQWLRTNRPNSLPYVNVFSDISDSDIDRVMTTIQPKALMHDAYPFGGYPETPAINWSRHLGNMMRVRAKANQYGVPYFSWMMTYVTGTDSHRFPSESELRMQVFSTLAGGCKGIGYFIYDTIPDYMQGGFQANAYVMDPPVKEVLYDTGSAINPQVKRLGGVLRYLTSTDVRFVPGAGQTSPSPHMQNWSAGAGGDPNITSVVVDTGQTGDYPNGLIGFFTEGSQRYFMLCNLNCHGLKISAATALDFTVTFSGGINQIYRLNRGTGLSEAMPLTNHQLRIDLKGGDGDLFSYSPIDTAPSGSVTINAGDASTRNRQVTLTLSASDNSGVSQMRFSNNMCLWSEWEPYATSKQWSLVSGVGMRTVHVQLKDNAGRTSEVYLDKIELLPPTPGMLSGHVTLPGYTGDTALLPVKIELLPQGEGTARTETVFLTGGQYTLTGVAPGTYNVRFSACEFLRKVVPGKVITSESGTTCDVTLVNGDTKGDNEVTTTDLSVVLKNIN